MAERIMIHIDDAAIPAQLNDTAAAQELFARLPVAIRMSASTVGMCGTAPFKLPTDPVGIHRGWTNGDINYNPSGGWLAMFFDDEENSQRYGDQFTIGRVEDGIEELRRLIGSYDVTIEPRRT